MIYQRLICIGTGATGFKLDQKAGSFDAAADRKRLHSGAQAHVDSVRRDAERPRYVLGFHVLIDQPQAISLPIGQLCQLVWQGVEPYCHNNAAPRWRGNVKAVCQILI